jgi:ABC-type xylose transport system permease subunit
MNTSSLVSHWYLHVPSLVLVALIYLLALRGMVGMLLGWESANPLSRALAVVTHPVLAVVGAVTPRSVPRVYVHVFAIVWLFALLMVLVNGLAALGRRPLWM